MAGLKLMQKIGLPAGPKAAKVLRKAGSDFVKTSPAKKRIPAKYIADRGKKLG